MITSKADAREKWEQLHRQTLQTMEAEGGIEAEWGSYRLDVGSLSPFLVQIDKQYPDVAASNPADDAVELFWKQLQPLRRTIDYPTLNMPEAVAEPLSSEHERLILNLLHHLQLQNQVPRDSIDDCYRTFLGIGKRGVLPELARIGLRLRGGR